MRVIFVWSEIARNDLRKIDKEQAMRILRALTRYAVTREGDVKALKGRLEGHLRLRVGNWRVQFTREVGADQLTVQVIQIENRGEAY